MNTENLHKQIADDLEWRAGLDDLDEEFRLGDLAREALDTDDPTVHADLDAITIAVGSESHTRRYGPYEPPETRTWISASAWYGTRCLHRGAGVDEEGGEAVWAAVGAALDYAAERAARQAARR